MNQHKIGHTRFSSEIDSNVIIFDKIGILAFAYEYAMVCYVGGGIHNRVHNTIEPAYFGLPICTGERIRHAPEAMELNSLGYLSVVKESKDILNFVNKYEDGKTLSDARLKIKEFVNNNRGASSKFYEYFLRNELL